MAPLTSVAQVAVRVQRHPPTYPHRQAVQPRMDTQSESAYSDRTTTSEDPILPIHEDPATLLWAASELANATISLAHPSDADPWTGTGDWSVVYPNVVLESRSDVYISNIRYAEWRIVDMGNTAAGTKPELNPAIDDHRRCKIVFTWSDRAHVTRGGEHESYAYGAMLGFAQYSGIWKLHQYGPVCALAT